MRTSRSARRSGLKIRIDRGPRGGVMPNETANANRTRVTIASRPKRRLPVTFVGPGALFTERELYARMRLRSGRRVGDHNHLMSKPKRIGPIQGQDLISLAQKLARDAERHAILSASLASQADRLMVAGLRQLELKQAEGSKPRPRALA